MRNGVKKQFWLTKEEAQDLKHKAEITGLTEVAVIRMLLKGYHPKEKPDRYFYDALRQLYYFGNNLDRLLKKANSLNYIDAPLLRQEIKAYASGNPACKSARKIPKSAPTKIVDAVNDKQKNLIIEYEHSTKIAAIIMMFMGLRTGELLALEWKDIDFDEKVVHINKKCSRCSSNQFIVKQGTKNGKNRTVPIPSLIADWLEEKLLDSTNSLIIPNKSGCLHTPTTWRRTWESYQCDLNYYAYVRRCKTKGITPKNKFAPTGIPDMGIKFNAHQLRHTYATMLYLSEVDVLTAKELLGHSDVKTTLGIYTHLEEKYKKLNIIKFDQYIQSELLNAASL